MAKKTSVRKSKTRALVTPRMSIAEAVCKYPKTAEVMMRYGMHCIGCQVAAMESISQGAAAHGLNKAQVAKMLKEMNAVAKRKR